MTKEEFCALPAGVALGFVWDAVTIDASMRDALESLSAPRPAQSPKFDTRCRTKGGYCWASECDLGQLRYYHERAVKPGGDPKYADKNEKEAKALLFFIRWREANPSANWQGERNHAVVRADAPSSRPVVRSWDDAPAQSSGGSGSYDDADYSKAADGTPLDDDIPFAVNVTCEPTERWIR